MRIRRPLAVVALGLLSTGCISQEKYNALRLERDGLNEQLARAQQDTSSARAQAAAWKGQIDQANSSSGGMAGLVQNLQNQNASLTTQLADVTARYNDAVARIGSGGPLPTELASEIANLADQNPGLIQFDAKSGMVKFTSDLTFSSGDAALKPEAQNVINQFAAILNSPAARGYELLVCGHADNQKVSAGTMSRGHKDNWYLSSHRALSVADALQRDGVNAKRIGAVGYGEHRPIADNSTPAGKAQNRRVEVMILPQQVADATPPANAAPAAQRPTVEVNTTNEDAALNK